MRIAISLLLMFMALIVIAIAIVLAMMLPGEVIVVEAHPVYYSPAIASEPVFQAHSGEVFWVHSTYTDSLGEVWAQIGSQTEAFGWVPRRILQDAK